VHWTTTLRAGTSSRPSIVATVLLEVASTVLEVASTVLEVAPTLLEVAPTLLEVAPTLLEVAPTLLVVAPTLLVVAPTLLEVASTVLEVASTVLEVASTVLEVAITLIKVIVTLLRPVTGVSSLPVLHVIPLVLLSELLILNSVWFVQQISHHLLNVLSLALALLLLDFLLRFPEVDLQEAAEQILGMETFDSLLSFLNVIVQNEGSLAACLLVGVNLDGNNIADLAELIADLFFGDVVRQALNENV